HALAAPEREGRGGEHRSESDPEGAHHSVTEMTSTVTKANHTRFAESASSFEWGVRLGVPRRWGFPETTVAAVIRRWDSKSGSSTSDLPEPHFSRSTKRVKSGARRRSMMVSFMPMVGSI